LLHLLKQIGKDDKAKEKHLSAKKKISEELRGRHESGCEEA